MTENGGGNEMALKKERRKKERKGKKRKVKNKVRKGMEKVKL